MDNNNERPLGWTTLEESEQLIKAGLSIETADMCYPHIIRGGADSYDANPETCSSLDYPYEMPCWSLGALIQTLPLSIQTKDSFPYKYDLELKLYSGSRYVVAYCMGQSHHPMVYTEKHGTLIEACVEMLIWCLNNKFYE